MVTEGGSTNKVQGLRLNKILESQRCSSSHTDDEAKQTLVGVSFGYVHVRLYQSALGDHPSVSGGVPIGFTDDWQTGESFPVPESTQTYYSGYVTHLSCEERMERCLSSGCTHAEAQSAINEVQRIKDMRRETLLQISRELADTPPPVIECERIVECEQIPLADKYEHSLTPTDPASRFSDRCSLSSAETYYASNCLRNPLAAMKELKSPKGIGETQSETSADDITVEGSSEYSSKDPSLECEDSLSQLFFYVL